MEPAARATTTQGGDDAPRPAPVAVVPQYYLENGCVVFTAASHLARGFCCGSGCRHCPFDPPHAAGSRTIRCAP